MQFDEEGDQDRDSMFEGIEQLDRKNSVPVNKSQHVNEFNDLIKYEDV